MSKSAPAPDPFEQPAEQVEPEDTEVEPEGLEEEEGGDRQAIPVAIRRSLREILGDEGEHVERVWLDALDSENERVRVEAAKVLTQASVQLARYSNSGGGVVIPKTVAEVEFMTMSECFAVLATVYVSEIESLRAEYGQEGAISRFRELHAENEVPLALLRRVYGRRQPQSEPQRSES
jgi:hypothetical protein